MPRIPFAIVVVALAAMVVVPGIASMSPTPTFLGWHMYSGYRTTLTFEIEHDDATHDKVDLGEIAGGLRVEIDYAERGAEFLCDRDATITTVRVHRDHPVLDEEFSCSAF